MTYKPKWAGYYIVNIFILSLNLFVHVTIIKIYNTIQYIIKCLHGTLNVGAISQYCVICKYLKFKAIY